ncbi:MAG: sulfatase-like hydrolase/transferase, partial [Micromonosporaceae bacterium]
GESVEFIDRARTQSQPFFLQLSTFAPHSRVEPSDTEPKFPPAMRDRPGHEFPNGDCGVRNGVRTNCLDLKVRRGTGFDEATYRTLDRDLRNRVRMVQSLNDQMIRIRSHLAGTGQLANTYFVFSSDNGFHLGEHGLLRGKGSPYDHDTRVPLIMTGPGVTAGAERTQIVQNVDLYATFQQMAGLTPRASDGRGLLGLARGETPTNWREAALYEHQGSEGPWNPQLDPDDADRDRATAAAGFVPGRHTYIGLRTDTWLYVEYAGGRRWLFDLRTDPGQNNNVHSSHPVVADRLSTTVRTYHRCGKGTAPSCWSAGQM